MAKFFKQIFAPYIAPALAAMVPGIGPALSVGLGAAGGALKKSTEPGKQSFGDLAGAGLVGGATGYGIGKGSQALGGMFKGGRFSGMGNALSSLNPFKSSNAYASQANAPTTFSGITSMGPGFNVGQGVIGTSGYSNPLVSQAMAPQSSKEGMFSGLGGLIKKNPLLATGIATGIGSQFIRSPRVPELPQSIRDFQSQVNQGSPLGNLASQRLTEQLNTPMQDVSRAEIEAALRQLKQSQEEELHQLTGTYKSLRPGTDITTDSSYAKDVAQLNDRYARAQADITAQLQRQVYNDFQGQRAQQIAQAQGFDINRISQLLQSGQLDIEQALAQFNVSDRDKQFLRNYLLQFGGDLVGSSLGQDTSGFDLNDLASLFQ